MFFLWIDSKKAIKCSLFSKCDVKSPFIIIISSTFVSITSRFPRNIFLMIANHISVPSIEGNFSRLMDSIKSKPNRVCFSLENSQNELHFRFRVAPHTHIVCSSWIFVSIIRLWIKFIRTLLWQFDCTAKVFPSSSVRGIINSSEFKNCVVQQRPNNCKCGRFTSQFACATNFKHQIIRA